MEVKNKPKLFPQYLAGIIVSLGAVGTGTVLGWTGNISTYLTAGLYNDIPIDETDFGWIGSISNLGAMCVCFPIGILCDKIGRKFANLLITIPFVVGWLLIIFSNSVGMLLAGRFVVGMAGGAFAIAAPLYTSEIASKEIRGTLGSYFQLFVTIGILLSYILGYVVKPEYFSMIVACVPVIFCILFFFQPETPVYRIMQKNEDAAKASLIRLRGKKYNIDDEIQEIKDVLEELERNNISIVSSMKKRSTKIAGVVSFSLMFFQQFSGINSVIFYASTIFTASGSSLKPSDATIIVGVIQVIASFASSVAIDRLGRKILLLISSFFMAIGLIILGAYFTIQRSASAETLSSLSFMPILGVALFITVYCFGLGPIPWMISSELYPTEIKSVASAAAGTFNWFLAFIITKFYGDLAAKVGEDVTFYAFAGFCVLATVFTIIVIPETKGKSLEQIQRELNNGKDKLVAEGEDNKGYI